MNHPRRNTSRKPTIQAVHPVLGHLCAWGLTLMVAGCAPASTPVSGTGGAGPGATGGRTGTGGAVSAGTGGSVAGTGGAPVGSGGSSTGTGGAVGSGGSSTGGAPAGSGG